MSNLNRRKPKIVVTKNLKFYEDQIKRLKSLGDVTFYNTDPKSTAEWLERCQGADIICTGFFGLKSAKVYQLKNVFFSVPFVGVEFLDKKKLKKNNVVVANTPGCNKEAVAEWMMGMMLMHFRRLCQLTRTTNPNKIEILQTATSLYHKKITILGAGHIGRQLAKICKSFGMQVVFFRRGDDLIKSVKDADVIANCLSLNDTTINLLNKKFFSSLKRGSFFVSAARPQIYDLRALKEALNKGILVGVADDASNAEAGDVHDPAYQKILNHPKILITPHLAWNADSDRRQANDMMIDNIESWLNKKPINLI